MGVYVCNLTFTVSREHTVLTVSYKTLEIISWNSRISWRRLTNFRCVLERVIELSDCPSISFRLRLLGVNGLCGIARFCREVDGDGCGEVPGRGDDCCVVGVCRGVRSRWVPV